MRELFLKHEIAKEVFPPFLQTWLNRSSHDYIFTSQQLQMWTSTHLRGVGWYLECGLQHVPDMDKDKFNSLEATGGNVLKAEALASLDDKACDKLIL
jgi:hypothetical protein